MLLIYQTERSRSTRSTNANANATMTATNNQDTLRTRTAKTKAVGPTGAVNFTTAASSRNVRFALRKKRTFAKTVITENEKNDDGVSASSRVNLSSYNSDFLSGLFADVAEANVLQEFQLEPTLPLSSSSSTDTTSNITSSSSSSSSRSLSAFEENDNDGNGRQCSSSHVISDSADSPRPLKKRRSNLQSSLFRSRASCANLSSSPRTEKNARSKNQDSLAFQLDCLETHQESTSSLEGRPTTPATAIPTTRAGAVSPSTKSQQVVKDVATLAFLNLPSAVSDSSCESSIHATIATGTGLTRVNAQVPHGQVPEITASAQSSRDRSSGKETFGWFVDLDEQETKTESNVSTSTSCSNNKNVDSDQDLAFQAPTAPKRSTNHVEEMEQAYAEDTIDSVLGDLPF